MIITEQIRQKYEEAGSERMANPMFDACTPRHRRSHPLGLGQPCRICAYWTHRECSNCVKRTQFRRFWPENEGQGEKRSQFLLAEPARCPPQGACAKQSQFVRAGRTRARRLADTRKVSVKRSWHTRGSVKRSLAMVAFFASYADKGSPRFCAIAKACGLDAVPPVLRHRQGLRP